MSAKLAFDCGDNQAWVGGGVLGLCYTFIKRCHAVSAFQRVLRADQPPDLIEAEMFEGVQAYCPMAFMRAAQAVSLGRPAVISGTRPGVALPRNQTVM